MKKSLAKLQQEVGRWQAETFGVNDSSLGKAAHLRKESFELYDQLLIDRERPTEAVAEETADVVILALGIAAKSGFDLTSAIEKKLAKNRARRWSAPDADGVHHHLNDAALA